MRIRGRMLVVVNRAGGGDGDRGRVEVGHYLCVVLYVRSDARACVWVWVRACVRAQVRGRVMQRALQNCAELDARLTPYGFLLFCLFFSLPTVGSGDALADYQSCSIGLVGLSVLVYRSGYGVSKPKGERGDGTRCLARCVSIFGRSDIRPLQIALLPGILTLDVIRPRNLELFNSAAVFRTVPELYRNDIDSISRRIS